MGVTLSDYKYEVFISYSHEEAAAEWTRELLYPHLARALHSFRPQRPRIFLDVSGLQPGGPWPPDLRDALLHSRCLVAVWSAPYRFSRWCQIEWQSMVRRQELLFQRGQRNLLLFPIRLADGSYYEDVRQQIQFEDLQSFYHIADCWRTSRLFPRFKLRIKDLAEKLVERIENAPAWEEGWPIVEDPDIPPFPSVTRKGM